MSTGMAGDVGPLAAWSAELLRPRGEVRGAFYLAHHGLLGDYLGVVCDSTSAGQTLSAWRRLLEARPDVLGVAVVPDLPHTLAFLTSDGQRLQWGFEELESLRAEARLGEAVLVFGPARLRDLLRRCSRLRRAGDDAFLADVDRLFWIDATAAADALAAFRAELARGLLERMQTHLWHWIDVREMEAGFRSRTFPLPPDPPADPDDLRQLASSVERWIQFYVEVRDRIARRTTASRPRRDEVAARTLVRRRLRALDQDLRSAE